MEAIQTCLEIWLPGSAIETVQRGREDSAGTFRILWANETRILYVLDEVLDLDAEGATSHLRRFRVSQTLREEGVGKTVVVTTRGASVFPV